jgi:hypothetical protein
VTHASNPSYSGGRDQEDHGLKPSWAKKFCKILSQKTGLVEWLKVKALSSSSRTAKKKKKSKKFEPADSGSLPSGTLSKPAFHRFSSCVQAKL